MLREKGTIEVVYMWNGRVESGSDGWGGSEVGLAERERGGGEHSEEEVGGESNVLLMPTGPAGHHRGRASQGAAGV